MTDTPRPEGPDPLPPLTSLEDANRARDGWHHEAWTYSGNSDYWRGRAEKAEAQLAAERSATLREAIGVVDQLATVIRRTTSEEGSDWLITARETIAALLDAPGDPS